MSAILALDSVCSRMEYLRVDPAEKDEGQRAPDHWNVP
jgi:hypothetical protein